MSVMSATERGWGNPDAPNYREKNIVKLDVPGVDTLYVHRAIAYLAEQFIKELREKYNYSIAKGRDDWGYANRNIFINGRDTGRKSNHSWGLALDLNATANPVSYDGRVHTNLPKNIIEIAAKFGFFWGGNYSASSYRDPMHFEFLGTPAEAVSLTAKVRRANAKRTPTYRDSSRLRGRFVVVRDGEGWLELAERLYGRREWYPIIRNANPNTKLKAGVQVYVPERFVKQQHKLVVARKGDTYRTLARRYYGKPRKYFRIKAANAGRPITRGHQYKVPL